MPDYVQVAIDYANAAVKDKAGRNYGSWIRKAAARFLADLKRAKRKRGAPFLFDDWHACDACGFIELLPHVEGEWDLPTIVLDPFQVFFLVQLFGFRKLDGTRRFSHALLAIGRKNGKALALDTPIPTPNGWRTMADIHPGDLVYGSDGAAIRVLAESEIFTDKRCFRVSFSDGSSVVASEDHQWTTRHKYRPWEKPSAYAGGKLRGSGSCIGRERTETIDTLQLSQSVMCPRKDGGEEFNHKLNLAPPLESAQVDLPIPPYVLGAWLGDGSTGCAQFTIGEQDIESTRAELELALRHPARCVMGKGKTAYTVNFPGSGLQATMRAEGLLGNKHIPDKYFDASASQRWDLLQGLMDTDGTVTRHAGQTTPRCSLTSVHEGLARDVWRLARSLGLKATICTGTARLYGRDIGPKWAVSFPASVDSPVFRMKRKQELLPASLAKRSRSISIVGCDEIEKQPVKCICVDSDDSLYLAGHGCIPTHNSALAAAIMLYVFVCEGHVGPQVIAAATTGDQARIVWKVAKAMVERTADLREEFNLEPFAHAIACYGNNGTFRPISAKASTQDGLNPAAVCLDEIHAHKSHDLLNVLKSAAGARRNQLWLYVTTEGYETPGPWPELRKFAEHILDGVVEAEHFLALVYALDDGDDEYDEKAWAKANPLLLTNPLLLDAIRREAIEAKDMPGAAAEFRIKRCNRRSSSAEGWIDLSRWRAGGRAFDLEDMVGHPCWGALDLASTRDTTAWRLVWLVDGVFYTWGRFWVPEDCVHQRNRRGTVTYGPWAEGGHMILTPGDVTDYARVEADVLADCQRFSPRMVAYDDWNASDIVNRLVENEIPLINFIQGPRSYHPAMQALERAYISGNLVHEDSPVLTWHAANLVARHDMNMNSAPDRRKSAEKIDGMCALLMAIGIAVNGESGISVYEERGLAEVR